MRVTPSVLAFVLVSGVAASASAQTPIAVDRSGYQIFDSSQITIDAVSLDQFAGRSGPTIATFYSSLGTDNTFGFSSTATGPSALIDDYTGNGIIGNGLLELTEVSFVGGVGTNDHIVFFDFFTTGGVLVDGFGVSLSSTQNMVWSFDLTGLGLFAMNSGFMQIAGDDGTNNLDGFASELRWFETNEPVDTGSNNDPTVFAFDISGVPTPGALALFGMAGLAASRRRR